MNKDNSRLYSIASSLALITISYNILEGLVSVFFGLQDEALSLFGFGIDSFVEVISGIGIWHMIRRIRTHGEERRDEFEKRALRITGTGFYILSAGLLATAVYNTVMNHKPEATVWGIIISLISIVSMSLLIHYKLKVGKALNSGAIISDANCTKTCLYLSILLLLSSVGFELFQIGLIDTLGALGIAYFSIKEGREAFEKVKTGKHCGCADECSS